MNTTALLIHIEENFDSLFNFAKTSKLEVEKIISNLSIDKACQNNHYLTK